MQLSLTPYQVTIIPIRVLPTRHSPADPRIREEGIQEHLSFFHMTIQPCVYILASRFNGTLYIGVTSDLIKRIWEHKNNVIDGFTSTYHVHILVWFEIHETMESAIAKEKLLKKWNRKWKLDLIEKDNSSWRDLYSELV